MNHRIEEAYCQYGTCVLLKRLGYDEYVSQWYCKEPESTSGIAVVAGHTHSLEHNTAFKDDGDLARPTQQAAMRWLREVHNTSVELSSGMLIISEMKYWAVRLVDLNNLTDTPFLVGKFAMTYEQAAEKGIKRAVRNLLKKYAKDDV